MLQRCLVGAAVLCFALVGTVLLSAQGAGQSPPRKTVWDGVFADHQASRGAATYVANCARCHGEQLEGNNGKPLVGDIFWRSNQARTVDYLLGYIRKNMPNGAPGTLTDAQYVDLTAFILSRNAFPAGSELTPESAVGVAIIQQGGSMELPPNALGRVIGCLAKTGTRQWVVNSATEPERTTEGKAAPEDVTRSLGTRSFPLLYVITPLDRFVGHRVAVRGLMVGAGGADGINVTEVESLRSTCD
jgi:mono/diheme cytochrome c family protein